MGPRFTGLKGDPTTVLELGSYQLRLFNSGGSFQVQGYSPEQVGEEAHKGVLWGENLVAQAKIAAARMAELKRLEKTRQEEIELEKAVMKEKAREIAESGMQLFTAPGFVPCSVPPPLRRVYEEASPAVNKMMADMWDEGKLLLLPTAMVRRVPGVHFSPMSWAPKADKKEGRPIGDLSSPQGLAVNCDAAADLVREAWGPIVLPTLS
jgi:hypothetical protein